jgi:hypothetical protein
LLLDYFEEERAAYAEKQKEAKSYLATGAYTLPDTLPLADMAAYTLVANTIFNLDEAITRG